jgi:3-deoxy-D-manno-octulosonic-acid transferase
LQVDLSQKIMDKILYAIFTALYVTGIRLLSFWNNKARLWVSGRKKFPDVSLPPNTSAKTIWMHCASLGEFEQGRPLLEALKKHYPATRIVLSFFSPSGYEVQKNYTGADYIFYLPVDTKTNASKLVKAINPSLVLWVKYEYWFYYLEELKQQQIPLLLVSGIFRPGQPFFKWYGTAWKKILPAFTHFFVQDEDSKDLLVSIGIEKNVTASGDTRFDRVIEIAEKQETLPLIEKFCRQAKVIVAGSTWEEDEAELIHYVRANPDIKFIIAPHETDAQNLKDIQKEFTGAMLYTELVKDLPVTANVLIIDNVGMLSRLYRYADITYVGGGFGADGVHNVLEAAVYGKPVIYGPEFEKFIEATDLIDCGGGITISSALELEKVLSAFWNDEQLLFKTGASAKNYVYTNGGATKKIMEFVQEKRLLIN